MYRRSKSLVCLALLLCLSFWLGAAVADEGEAFRAPDWDPILGAPHGPSEWEKAHEHEFDFIYPETDDPPTAPIVQAAEWEPMSKVLIRWPLGLSTALIAEMSENCIVVTIVANTSTMNTAINSYTSAGVNMSNCEWLIAPSNSIWTRDYGPWWVFDGNDEQGIVDHIYNRPTRPDDNNIPWVYGAEYNIPVYGMPVVHSGGNYMCDGMGIGMSTDLVYNENSGMGPAMVDQYLFEYCGIEDYDVRPDILTSGIHHIDCWAKMLTPDKIIAKRLNPPNSTLEANVEYWENKISSYGTPYEVIRVDCYSSTPYTNSLILNDKVLVPIFGSDLDDEALQTYADAMPGYEILGFTGSWVSDDAIHCRAKGIADQYMLRLVHVPLQDRENNGQPYEVEADIHSYSNLPMVPGTPELMWRLEGQTTWNTVAMGDQGDDIYVGYIPEQANFSTIEYYVHAEDESGRREDHPYIGAPDPHSFHIGPDVIAPEIVHQPLGNLSTYEWPATITCIATDNGAISSVTVEWFLNSAQQT
ncbi:agmatine deiminase family protein, partial [bacterium]|nr:agmatine deiminase family protein [bacterium]